MLSEDIWAPSHLPAGSEDGHRGLCLEMAQGQGSLTLSMPHFSMFGTQTTRKEGLFIPLLS